GYHGVNGDEAVEGGGARCG
ncbi:hypothetical protein Tco_0070308, partial [Tanacetum coccineum]